jgi:hypothetical protein
VHHYEEFLAWFYGPLFRVFETYAAKIWFQAWAELWAGPTPFGWHIHL